LNSNTLPPFCSPAVKFRCCVAIFHARCLDTWLCSSSSVPLPLLYHPLISFCPVPPCSPIHLTHTRRQTGMHSETKLKQRITLNQFWRSKRGFYKLVIYHIVSYHIVSYHIISYHNISYHIISYHIISYHIISYHIISYHIISYHIISCYIISYYIISDNVISFYIYIYFDNLFYYYKIDIIKSK